MKLRPCTLKLATIISVILACIYGWSYWNAAANWNRDYRAGYQAGLYAGNHHQHASVWWLVLKSEAYRSAYEDGVKAGSWRPYGQL